MKTKFLSFVEFVVAPIILSGLWYFYTQYFLVKNPNSDYNYISGENSQLLLVGLAVLTVIMLACFIYTFVKAFRFQLNKEISSRATSQLAYDLSRLYLDRDFLKYCAQFGIEMGYDYIKIKPEVMAKCWPQELAKLLVYVFNKNNSADFDFDKIFYSLADLILKSWPEKAVDDFCNLVYQESIILGQQLRYIIERQKINNEANNFNQSVEARLSKVDEIYETKNQVVLNKINKDFAYYNYLLNGGSVFYNWLSHKLPFKLILKPIILE